MVFPLVPSPTGGNLGASTASFFKLDPLGIVAIEPLIDLLPGVTPLRVTLDMVDGESITYDYETTDHAIQSFLDVTSNVHKKLEVLTINGTLGAELPLGAFGPIPPLPNPGGIIRLDLVRITNLKNIADARQPIMVVTPRYGLAKAFITQIVANWSPAESTTVSITCKEARIVSPISGDLLPDFPAQAPGNSVASGGGQSATAPVGGATTTPAAATGQAPGVNVPP